MQTRIDEKNVAPGAMNAMLGLEKYLGQSQVPKKLLDLVRLRVSQINGCAFCIDMHWKDLRAAGENEQRLYGLDAWAESTYYTDRERAALAWAEGVTRVAENRVPDELFQETRRYFSEAEIADLTLCVAAINAWNRLNIAFRTPAGTYQPAAKARTEAKGQPVGAGVSR